MHNKKAISAMLIIMFCFVASFAFGESKAVLTGIKGKVEVKDVGAAVWVPATEGMTLNLQATLSTGFDSTVTVVIDKTTMVVKPLTRLSIDKLVVDQGKVTTSTFLRVGSVQTSVKSADGVKQDFSVKSPYSTASVRGTDFDFDGLHLVVDDGLVAFLAGRPHRDVDNADPSDFAGAPEGDSDGSEVFVPKGDSVTFSISYDGSGNSVQSSSSEEGLSQSSNVTTSQTQRNSNPIPAYAPGTGGVTVTW